MGFKAERKKGDGVSATLVLLYLSLGKDFPYNMAKSFSSNLTVENGWDEEIQEYVKKLKDKNQLSVLMKEMEEKGLLVSEKEQKGRRKRFYKINPIIIYISETTETEREARDFCLDLIFRGDRVKKDPEEIEKLMDALENQDCKFYYKKWNKMNFYDFISFLNFLEQEAIGFKLERAYYLIKDHLAVLKYRAMWESVWPLS